MSGALTLSEIGDLAKAYAAARDGLATVTDEVREVQRREVRKRLRGIKARVAEVSATREQLVAAIDENRQLFESPRTRAMHGIKFGLRKQPGRIEGDAAAAIARIDRRMADRARDLVATKRTLVKAALQKLSTRELAALGLTIAATDDAVVVQAAGDDLDALVDAMLEDVADVEEATA